MDDVRAGLEQLHPESFGWALCCCRRDSALAEDVLQRVYVTVLSGEARHEGTGSFRTWLFGVIRRTAQDERRREWLRAARLMQWFGRSGGGERTAARADAPAEEAERRARLLAGLERLPERQREVLHLVFYQGMSIAEAAAVMGISVGTARTHYERGKDGLSRELGIARSDEADDEHRPGRRAATGAVR
jgi:RNA polymerase sigma-70 factor (ECF subfamily)